MEDNKCTKCENQTWDTIYRCNNCNIIIGNKSNKGNIDNNNYSQISQNLKLSNDEFILFIKGNQDLNREIASGENLIERNTKNRKLICKSCNYEIGLYKNFYVDKSTLTVGILQEAKITFEEIPFNRKSETNNKIHVKAKYIIENISQIKQFTYIKDMVESYAKDYYNKELMDVKQTMERIKEKLITLDEIIETEEI